jgi:phosphoribosylaminoimidazole-succinocarboxamide synthase
MGLSLEKEGVDRLTGLEPDFRGKVREVFDLGNRLLFVATDRVSAYDAILPTLVPGRGKVLTALSIFWFRFLEDTIPHHFLSDRLGDLPEKYAPHLDTLKGRSMIVKKAERIDVECVVRGYIAGSAWQEYKHDRTVCGIGLPEGLKKAQKFSEPIFTPATKADTGHDENISYSVLENMVGSSLARELRDVSILLYTRAAEYALPRGIIIADTKFEFGYVSDTLTLIDEVLSPDSSRFWPAEQHEAGTEPPSFDKQIIRNYLDEIGWDRSSPPPRLSEEIVQKTQLRYMEAMKRLEAGEL